MNDQTLPDLLHVRREAEVRNVEEAHRRIISLQRRIGEVERSERRLINERDALALKLENMRNVVGAALEPGGWNDIFPAAKADEIVRIFDVVQRRDIWFREVTRLGIDGPVTLLGPHDGETDPITILVVGSGGYGDMLYLTTVVRALYHKFNRARIAVLHEHPGSPLVFRNNPHLLTCLSLQGSSFTEFLRLAAALDIFDLIADVRYAVSYATPPLSRIPHDFLRAAHGRAIEWQFFVRDNWPYHNNDLARETTKRGMSQLDLVGYTANLDIDKQSRLCFFPAIEAEQPELASLVDIAYATVHHGADKNMSSARGLQTKNLPIATWRDIIPSLHARGLRTVQLGESHEDLIDGVDLDLRGRTTFDMTAAVIKGARVHVDTEGGLVHVARSMYTRSVVAFGPTSLPFFGYVQNINFPPKVCGDCWWLTRSWSVSCPRHMEAPECMASHAAAELVDAAAKIASERVSAKLADAKILDGGAEKLLAEVSKSLLSASPDTPLVVDNLVTLNAILATDPTMDRAVHVADRAFQAAGSQWRCLDLRPFSSVGLAAESEVHVDLIIVATLFDTAIRRVVLDAFRTMQDNGRVIVFIADLSGLEFKTAADLFRGVQLGNRVKIVDDASGRLRRNSGEPMRLTFSVSRTHVQLPSRPKAKLSAKIGAEKWVGGVRRLVTKYLTPRSPATWSK